MPEVINLEEIYYLSMHLDTLTIKSESDTKVIKLPEHFVNFRLYCMLQSFEDIGKIIYCDQNDLHFINFRKLQKNSQAIENTLLLSFSKNVTAQFYCPTNEDAKKLMKELLKLKIKHSKQ